MWRLLSAGLTALAIAGCSESVSPKAVLGHWTAENLRIQAVGIPIGPELDITEQEIAVPGTALRVPLQRVEAKGREVTLTFPMGLSLAFQVESPERMSVDVPFIGLVHYRKDVVARSVAAVQATPPATTTGSQPVSKADLVRQARDQLSHGQADQARTLLDQVAALDPRYAPMLVGRLVLMLADSGPDETLRQMDQWLQAGVLKPGDVAGESGLSALHQDPRYRALSARYQ